MFFRSRFLDLLFLTFSNFFQIWSILGPPSKSDGILNGTQINQVAPKCTKFYVAKLFFAVFFQTLFSRNHSNPCAVGTSWLLQGHFFDVHVHWLIFCFRCVSLCFVLYNIFDPFSNNLGKRPAVELLVFLGNRRT